MRWRKRSLATSANECTVAPPSGHVHEYHSGSSLGVAGATGTRGATATRVASSSSVPASLTASSMGIGWPTEEDEDDSDPENWT